MMLAAQNRRSKRRHAGFDPSVVQRDQAIAVIEKVGAIRRLADGVFGQGRRSGSRTPRRTRRQRDRNAAELCARVTGCQLG